MHRFRLHICHPEYQRHQGLRSGDVGWLEDGEALSCCGDYHAWYLGVPVRLLDLTLHSMHSRLLLTT